MSSAFKVIKSSKSKQQDLKIVGDDEAFEASLNQAIEETRVLLTELVKKITHSENDIPVTYKMGEKTVQFYIDCPKVHIGRLIGSKGATINALRVISNAITSVYVTRAVIEIPYFAPDDK